MNGRWLRAPGRPLNFGRPTAMRRTWPFVVVSIVLTPLLLYVALASAGAGNGSYFWAKVLFPYTMLAAKAVNSITPVLADLATVQVPIYGLLLGLAAKAARLFPVVVGLVVFHTIVVTASFVVPMRSAFP
jgi:hypothetical protein